MRRSVVELARTLASLEIGCFIPDLPGCGESGWDISDIRLSDWRAAIADVTGWLALETGRPPHIAALRGGALLDDAGNAASWWRFAPATGKEFLRPLQRASRLSGAADHLAGYALQPEMIADLESAIPRRPSGLIREYTAETSGTPLWRRAEPSEDAELVRALADDLGDWIRTCGAA